MADDLVFHVGETRKIARPVRSFDVNDNAQAFIASAVTCTIWDANRNVIVNAAAGAVDSGTSATVHQVYYLWNTTGQNAGDYTWQITYSNGTETLIEAGRVSLIQGASRLDPWLNRITDWLLETEMGEARQLLSTRQMRSAAFTAVKQYQRIRPQLKRLDIKCTGGTFEYALPVDWVTEFSEFVTVQYPTDDTQEDEQTLEEFEYRIEELRGVWKFLTMVPATGDVVRLYYTTPHVLTDSIDTTPPKDFDAIAQYAAGVALMTLANRAASTSAPVIGAQMVNYRTKQQEYRQQAQMLIEAAIASWGTGVTSEIAMQRYFADHGRIIYWSS